MTDDQPKRGPGRPKVYGKRQNFAFRVTEETRQRLIDSAMQAGRSMSEEIEFRINRDFGWEATKADIDQLKCDAMVWRNADRLNVLRLVGYQILRETDGRPTRVVVDLQSLLAEADGIARGLRSGFDDDTTPASPPSAERTADEERHMLQELEQLKRKVDEAIERTRAADEAASQSGKVARKR